jgi:hypothetical protein
MKQEPKRTVTIIPAAPGHHAISFEVLDGVVHIYTSPIIAWEVVVVEHKTADHFRRITPIPADNCAFDAVLHPDGQVDRNDSSPSYGGSWEHGDVFASLDDYRHAAYKHHLA